MREIKFRVWNNEEKTMIENKDIYSIDFRNNIYFSSVMVDGFISNEDDYKLMQYTGLKDINGKEIYEGDIVHIDFVGLLKERTFEGVVNFYDGMFIIDGKDMGYPLFDEINVKTVKGNIYENKDLLK